MCKLANGLEVRWSRQQLLGTGLLFETPTHQGYEFHTTLDCDLVLHQTLAHSPQISVVGHHRYVPLLRPSLHRCHHTERDACCTGRSLRLLGHHQTE